MEQNDRFTIRQMIELTGLSEFTIRGWEGRYQAFSPERSDTGRREYSKKDIERALLIRELLKRGKKISKIACLSNQQLQNLFEGFESEQNLDETQVKTELVKTALEMMALQKWTPLSKFFKETKFKSINEQIHYFLLPLIQELSHRVSSGLVSIAQEHILSSYIKEKIYSSISEIEKKRKHKAVSLKNRFILATPEGDYHDIGLLLAHLMIKSHGFTSLFLGPHSPAQDLSETALRFNASHLLIVSTVGKKEGARDELIKYVSEVQKKIGADAKILLAGVQAPHFPLEIQSRIRKLENFFEFESYLKTIGGKQK